MKILIGCPIYKRDWILDHWIHDIVNQSVSISDIGFAFEVSPNDDETLAKLEFYKDRLRSAPHFDIKLRDDLPHFEHLDNGRQWTLSKYSNMVSLRNSLLQTARSLEPDYYFSLDSDILLKNPNTIELLVAHVKNGADAVNPLMYMTPSGTSFPSVMTWKRDGTDKAFRQDSYPIGKFFEADVIMAAKMMSKNVYTSVDYEIHLQGEDLGWSANCKKNGMRLYCASYIYAPHIMSRNMYGSYLKSGDDRGRLYQSV